MGRSKDLATGSITTDFTVDTDTLKVDSSNDRVLINTTTAGRAAEGADQLTIEAADDGHSGLTIRSGSSSYGSINFSDSAGGAGEYQASIFMLHGTDTLTLATAGSDRVKIDSSGRVTMPSQPQFVLQGSYNAWTFINQASQWLPLTGSTAVATSTNNELAMNWTSSRAGGYNPSGNGINANTGIYTAPVNGTYMFTFQSYILKGAGGGGYIHINSYINGSDQQDYTIYGYNLAAGAYTTPEITKVIRMSANDTFAFRLYSNVTDYRIYPHYTCLTGYLLG